MRKILKVGDTVLFETNKVKVKTITLAEDSMLDGPGVAAIFWESVEGANDVTLTFESHNRWAYGYQVQPA